MGALARIIEWLFEKNPVWGAILLILVVIVAFILYREWRDTEDNWM
ncbi:MAG: FeoB-associated Cys-rich membrane protein [Phycisphaeraceae bacterium]|nr:FeoB-associated Cys-rich membrane protein [Phycisphaeraceae bacterium]